MRITNREPQQAEGRNYPDHAAPRGARYRISGTRPNQQGATHGSASMSFERPSSASLKKGRLPPIAPLNDGVRSIRNEDASSPQHGREPWPDGQRSKIAVSLEAGQRGGPRRPSGAARRATWVKVPTIDMIDVPRNAP